MAITLGSDRVQAWLGAAGFAALFVILRASGVFTPEKVFPGPGADIAVALLYSAVLAGFGACLLVLSHRIGQRWAATRGLAGYWAAMGLGIHVIAWCGAGVVVGSASASGNLHQAAWTTTLLVLLASASVFFTAACALLRLRQS
ncbi:hypothetical protein KKR91_05500 [Arthrobacter jiangjiafuii]|uniref:Uncharacterized protein n=1 Tax=Arthrobacter jiangjiafuii TaxID=2817475 RepID=A0A975M6Y1_9MICC|nr:hypothetical protein [Arthrobacter jiangjiafuii]MBP3044061.1 hypothetical protein [Arthrobacter jiangjiafuii]QWC11047.1 hypothetical protein KKR91_05500 [Arthrobacter jiangjiafuii]